MKKTLQNIIIGLLSIILLVLLASCNEEPVSPPEGTNSPGTSDVTEAPESNQSTGEMHVHVEVITEGAAPTCTKDGYTERIVCSECGECLKEAKPIYKLGHDIVITPAIEGSCTQRGMTEGKSCQRCGKVYIESILTPYVHNEVVNPAIEGTCTERGKSVEVVCADCGVVVKSRIPTDYNHKEKVTPGIPATCENDGKTESISCELCGKVLKPMVYLPRTHVYIDSSIEYGCTVSESVQYKKCTVCGYVLPYTRPLTPAPSQHSFGADGKCTGCGKELVPTEGLVFELVDGSYYRLVDVGMSTPDIVIIPETYNGLPVSEIGIMYNGLYAAFSDIYIPKTVSKIDISGSRIYNFTVDPESPYYEVYDGMLINKKTKTLVKYFGNAEHVTVPGGKVKRIASNAFSDIDSIKKITFGNGVTTIENGAVYFCGNLEEIVLPETALYIANGPFSACYKLKPFKLPSGIKYLPKAIYSGIETLTKIELPKGITEISESAFYDTGLTEIDIPSTVKTIAQYAFARTDLKKVVIPEGVTSIESTSFYNCHELEEVYIPASVEYIGSNAFAGCNKLSKIIVDKDNPIYHDVEGCLVETKTKTLMFYAFSGENVVIPDSPSIEILADNLLRKTYGYEDKISSVVIPEGIKKIGAYFAYSKEVKILTIPSTVVEIGSYAFAFAELEEIEFKGNSLKRIERFAFVNCPNLKVLNLPNSVEYIGNMAFRNSTLLKDVVLPDSLGYLGDNAFPDGVLKTNP